MHGPYPNASHGKYTSSGRASAAYESSLIHLTAMLGKVGKAVGEGNVGESDGEIRRLAEAVAVQEEKAWKCVEFVH